MKSYFARHVRAALAMAQKEMGPLAMIVSSRQASEEEVEVVCTLPEDALLARTQAAPQLTGGPSPSLVSLRQELDEIRSALRRLSLPAPAWLPRSSALAPYYAALIDSEVEPELALDVIEAIQLRQGSASIPEPSLHVAVKTELASRLQATSTPVPPACIVVVGPPGAGKTSLLVKIAVQEGLRLRRTVQFLSMDCYRVGAADQLRNFATILGAGFKALDSVEQLPAAVQSHSNRDLLLIDTPGIGSGELELIGEMAGALGGLQVDFELHLVLPATLRTTDLRNTLDRFSPLHPNRIALTRLDETSKIGPVFSLAAKSGIPVSWLSNGQRIPEDLQQAAKSTLTDLLLPAGTQAQTAAAVA